jgi:periplasmic mercuric ion binding protein
MKRFKVIMGMLTFLFSSVYLYAQTDTITIKTSAICDECKERIEHDLAFVKGVKVAKLDLDTKMVTVLYNAQKTSPAKIAEAISRIGYDADSLKADAKAFKKLPECCQRPMHENHH